MGDVVREFYTYSPRRWMRQGPRESVAKRQRAIVGRERNWTAVATSSPRTAHWSENWGDEKRDGLEATFASAEGRDREVPAPAVPYLASEPTPDHALANKLGAFAPSWAKKIR